MRDPNRRTLAPVLLTLLGLAACSSSSHTLTLSVNPPDASVYLNGDKLGQGNSRPVVFDFSQYQRVYLQATHPDFEPEFEWFDKAKVEAMLASRTDVLLTLRSR